MENKDQKQKKGILAAIWESMTRTGGCCGSGESCCGSTQTDDGKKKTEKKNDTSKTEEIEQ